MSFPDYCECHSEGLCKATGRLMTIGMVRECQTNSAFRKRLSALPVVAEGNKTAASLLDMPQVPTRIELPCIYRSPNPIEYASCGCHVYDCEYHEAKVVPWRKAKLVSGIRVCEECNDRVATSPKKISIQAIQELISEDLMGVCITLKRRPNRWQWFSFNSLITGIEPFIAIDGKNPTIPMPEWWNAGRGAWGCHLSHQAVLQKAIEQNKSYLVFEDDALFDNHFVDKVKVFLENVPSDWDMIYFGGQHLGNKRPVPISKNVQRGMKINRTHAFMVRNTFLERLASHLRYMTNEKKRPHHVDWRIQMLHPKYKVYSPTKWLVGQRGGVSDIGKSFAENRFWR